MWSPLVPYNSKTVKDIWNLIENAGNDFHQIRNEESNIKIQNHTRNKKNQKKNTCFWPLFGPLFFFGSIHNLKNQLQSSFCEMAPCDTISKRSIPFYSSFHPDNKNKHVFVPFVALNSCSAHVPTLLPSVVWHLKVQFKRYLFTLLKLMSGQQ